MSMGPARPVGRFDAIPQNSRPVPDSVIDVDSSADELEDEKDNYVEQISGVRSFVIKRGPQNAIHTAPSKLRTAPSWTPKQEHLQLSKKLDFSTDEIASFDNQIASMVLAKGEHREEVVTLYKSLKEKVHTDQQLFKKHLRDCQESIEEKERTISRLVLENRALQDASRNYNRQVEDLKTEYERAFQDAKKTQRKELTVKDREIQYLEAALEERTKNEGAISQYKRQVEELKAASEEMKTKLDGLISEHEREIENMRTSLSLRTKLFEDRHRNEMASLRSRVRAALGYTSDPDSSSVQLTQVSLCKQEEKGEASGKL